MKPSIQVSELSKVILSFGSKTSKALFLPNQKNTRLRLLARKFAINGDKDERRWAQEICKTDEHDHTYIRLRSQLKRRLIGDLFHLDIRSGSEVRKAIYHNARELFAIRMLIMFGARVVGVWLIPQALARARKYELTQNRIELLQLLRNNAALQADRNQFPIIVTELEEVVKLRNAEMRLESLDASIHIQTVARAHTNVLARSLAEEGYREAGLLFKQFPTFNIGLLYYRLATLYSEAEEFASLTFRLCDEAEKFFDKFQHLISPSYRGQFALKRLSSSIAIRNHEGARSAIEGCDKYFPEPQNNWFIWKENECFLLIQLTDFEAAAELHKSIIHHARFSSQPDQVQQRWVMYGGYIAFALSETDPQRFQKRAKNRLLKEVPVYTKDKAGYNAGLLILQQLILYSEGNFSELIERADAIREYSRRYLRYRHHSQLFGFLKTLYLLQKYQFDLEKTRKRAKRWIEQFHKIGLDRICEEQVLPFDMMWKKIEGWVLMPRKPEKKRLRKKTKKSGVKPHSVPR